MASECSFDIVSKADLQEVDNAVNQAVKEISQRFDFRGSKSEITLNKTENKITLVSDNETKLESVIDVLESKLIKRGISISALDFETINPSANQTVTQIVKIQQGIVSDKCKEITRTIKDAGLKVRTQILGDYIRVIGKSKDDLQTVIVLLKSKDFKTPLQFTNYK
ncbi:MAG: YajQ family cyclic di-GMP-binding protein [Candidatus Firestonebacteria bacterium]